MPTRQPECSANRPKGVSLLPKLFLWVALGYFGLQVLFVVAVVAIAFVRVLGGRDRAANNETMPVGENVVAIKETNNIKEVIK